MARRYYSNRANYGTKKNYRKANSTKSNTGRINVKSFAYLMGQVSSGLKNSNSQVSASYKAGQNSVQFKNKKPLF